MKKIVFSKKLIHLVKALLLLVFVGFVLFFSPVGCGETEDACEMARKECRERGYEPYNCNETSSGTSCTQKQECECECRATNRSTISGNISSTNDSVDLNDITVTISANESVDSKDATAAITPNETIPNVVVTDTNGNYTFYSLANGIYTVAPFKCGYNFTPPTQTVTINEANVTSISFEVQKEGVVTGNGTVNLKGGCWIITGDDGCLYDPINLTDDFKEDGLAIKFEMKLMDVESNCNGITAEVISIGDVEQEE